MTDEIPPVPPVPAVRRRPRRFVLPTEHHDARTSERIEAFLEGPPRPQRRRRSVQRPHHPISFESPESWRTSLEREQQRIVRYGRPASVVVIEVDIGPGNDIEHVDLTEPVAAAIRHEARETDRVLRVAATRFLLLLPETGESAAAHFVERLTGAWRDRSNGHADYLHVRTEALSPGHGQTLVDAIAEVERRLQG